MEHVLTGDVIVKLKVDVFHLQLHYTSSWVASRGLVIAGSWQGLEFMDQETQRMLSWLCIPVQHLCPLQACMLTCCFVHSFSWAL